MEDWLGVAREMSDQGVESIGYLSSLCAQRRGRHFLEVRGMPPI